MHMRDGWSLKSLRLSLIYLHFLGVSRLKTELIKGIFIYII